MYCLFLGKMYVILQSIYNVKLETWIWIWIGYLNLEKGEEEEEEEEEEQ